LFDYFFGLGFFNILQEDVMKKILLFVLIFATLRIAGIAAQDQFWFVTGREGGTRAANNQLTLRAGQTNYVYVYFRGDMNPVGAEFEKMIIDFVASQEVEVVWQCVYYQSMQGGVLGSEESTGVRDKGPIETDFSKNILVWSGRERALVKPMMNGFCLAVTVPRGAGNVTFTMNKVEFVGLQK